MICTKCGKEVPEGNGFCIFCGTPMEQMPVEASKNMKSEDSWESTQQWDEAMEPTMVWTNDAARAQPVAPEQQGAYAQPAAPNQPGAYVQPATSQGGGQDGPQSGGTPPNLWKEFVRDNVIYYEQAFYKINQQQRSWNWCSCLFCGNWFMYRKMYGNAAIIYLAALFSSFIPFSGIALMIFLGFKGNNFYQNFMQGKLREMPQGMTEAERAEWMRKNGGTSVAAVIIGILIMVAISIVIGLISAGIASSGLQ